MYREFALSIHYMYVLILAMHVDLHERHLHSLFFANTEPGSRFTVTKFRQVRASRGARMGGVEWGVAFNDFNFNAELQK
jgi:hypothetical protein